MSEAKRARQNGSEVELPKGTEPKYLVPFLSYANNNLEDYLTKLNNNEQADWRIKEALLLAIGNLADAIYKVERLRESMEEVHKNHVLGELSSP
jgi:hypothetical protein